MGWFIVLYLFSAVFWLYLYLSAMLGSLAFAVEGNEDEYIHWARKAHEDGTSAAWFLAWPLRFAWQVWHA